MLPDPEVLIADLQRLFAQDVQSSNLQQEGTHVPRPKKNKGYTPPESQPYVGIRTAMEILGVTKQGVKKLIDLGKFPSAYQIDLPGGAWAILREEIERYKSERESN